MNIQDARQTVELFHLVFLDQMGRKLDKRNYVLKGGCNLRFFMKSFRYSEDIDIDAQTIPKEKLIDTVEGILKGTAFTHILGIKGIKIERFSAPKQTDTTQRWKILLSNTQSQLPLHTKIEFSRRGFREGAVFESITPEIIKKYSISPIMANHYDMQSAYEQKIEALATRNTVQARDVFDLHLLISSGVNCVVKNEKTRGKIDLAASNAMIVTFDIFKSQVLSYLANEYQSQYDSKPLWEDIVLKVADFITEGGKSGNAT